jgi:hypothetical protein
MHRDQDEPPPPRRRSGETDKGFIAAWRAVLRRAGIQVPMAHIERVDACNAFGDAAKAVMQRVARMPAEAYMASTAYLFDTIDWLNLWEANSSMENSSELDLDYNTQQNNFPHL